MDSTKTNSVDLNAKLLSDAEKYVAEHKVITKRQQVEETIDALKVMRDVKKLSFAQITEIYKANGIDASHVIIRDVYKTFNSSKPAGKRKYKDKEPAAQSTETNAESAKSKEDDVKSNGHGGM